MHVNTTYAIYWSPSGSLPMSAGYQPLITHLFRQGAPYLENDVVFGVREPLITPFKKQEPGPAPGGHTLDEPWFTADYDFVLAPAA